MLSSPRMNSQSPHVYVYEFAPFYAIKATSWVAPTICTTNQSPCTLLMNCLIMRNIQQLNGTDQSLYGYFVSTPVLEPLQYAFWTLPYNVRFLSLPLCPNYVTFARHTTTSPCVLVALSHVQNNNFHKGWRWRRICNAMFFAVCASRLCFSFIQTLQLLWNSPFTPLNTPRGYLLHLLTLLKAYNRSPMFFIPPFNLR